MSMTDDPTGPRRGNPNNRQGQHQQYPDQQRYQQRPDQRMQRPGVDPYAQYQQPETPPRGPAPVEPQRQPAYSGYRQAPAPPPAEPDRYAADPRRAGPNASQMMRPAAPGPAPRPQQQGGFQDQRYYQPEPAAQAADDRIAAYEPDPSLYQNDGIYGSQYAETTFHADDAAAFNSPAYDAPSADYVSGSLDFSGHALPDRYAAQPQTSPAAPSAQQQPSPQEMHSRFFVHDSGAADYNAYVRQPASNTVPPQVYQGQNYDYQAEALDHYTQVPPPQQHALSNWDDYGDDPQRVPPALLTQQDRRGPEEDLDADFFSDDHDYEGEEAVPQTRGRSRKKLVAAVLTAALVVGGGAGYYLTSGDGPRSASGEPPVLSADGSPVKESPNDPGGRQFANQGKKIYDRLTGDGSDSGAGVAGVITTTSTSPQGGSLDERIENALKQAKKGEEAGGAVNPDEPRIVSTQLYRPDGSPIVQPAAKPAPTAFPGLAVTTAPAAEPAAKPAPFSAQRETVPTSIQQAAILPKEAATREQPRAQPVAAPQQAAAPGFYLQISSSNDEAKANAELATLRQKYTPVLGEYPINTQSVDLGDKGIWYRIRVGPVDSKQAASDLCLKLKAAGIRDCLVRAQ